MAKLFLYVFIGGGIGSALRFGAGLLMSRLLPQAGGFPVSTITVNIVGSFLIGLLWASPAIANRGDYAALLITGLCGGFTTFSAFSWESFDMLRNGLILPMVCYAAASVALCLLAAWGGYSLMKAFN